MRVIKTTYYCDYCEKDLKQKSHICIHIKDYAGVVSPPKWKNVRKLEDRPYQFCSVGICLTAFLLNNCTKKEERKKNRKKRDKI